MWDWFRDAVFAEHHPVWWLQFLFGDYLQFDETNESLPLEERAGRTRKTRRKVLQFFALATYLALAFMAGALIYLFTGQKKV